MSGVTAKQLKVAIVGATGFLGREVLKAMDESELLLIDPVLLATADGVGEVLTCQGADVTSDSLADADFKDVTVALFCCDAETTKKYAPKAMQAGALVLDASGGLREKGVLLKTLEGISSPQDLRTKGGVLPQPIAQSLSVVLGGINDKFPITEATASTYQTVAGAGFGAVEEVAAQSAGLLGGGAEGGFSSDLFAHQAAFNVLPQVGAFTENGTTAEEDLIAADFAKLQGGFPLSVSCAYVPTFVGDAVDVSLRFNADTAPAPEDIRDLFSPASGVMVLDDVAQNEYATPYGTAETSYVFLSRVRRDPAFKNGLKLWIAADHIRVAQARKLVKYTETIAHQVQ